MVLTRNGTDTLSNSSEMNALSLTTPGVAYIQILMEKAKANENARLANETWFNRLDNEPMLDDLMEISDS